MFKYQNYDDEIYETSMRSVDLWSSIVAKEQGCKTLSNSPKNLIDKLGVYKELGQRLQTKATPSTKRIIMRFVSMENSTQALCNNTPEVV